MPKKQKPLRWLAGAALQNPVLVQAAGLTPVIVATTSLQGGLWVAAIVALHLIICELLATGMKRVPSWLRVAVYFAIGLAIACPMTIFVDFLTDKLYVAGMEYLAGPSALSPLRLFLPLVSVNALTAMRCERYAILHTPRDALRDALTNALGYAVVAALVGAAREMLGYGTLMGVTLSENLHIRGAWMPFGGFLLLGAMAALLKVTLRGLSARGIYAGADKALELAPEDRLERLEKTRNLMIAEVRQALKEKEAPPREEENIPEEDILEAFAPASPAQEAETPRQPRIPVDDILREYGLDSGDDGFPHRMTEEEKMRLVLELEELLDEFKGGDAK